MPRSLGPLAALLLALAVGALVSRRQEAGGASQATSSAAAPAAATASGGTAAASTPLLDGVPLLDEQLDEQVNTPGDTASSSSSRPQWHSRPAGGGLHIVRFRRYEMAAVHRSALEAALSSEAPAGSWEWVDRRNKAAAYPTDFGLLRLGEAAEGALKAQLERLPFVRDVHPERQITRSLLAAAEGDPAAAQQQQQQEGSIHAGQHQQPSGCTGGSADDPLLCVTKRPGRLQTRPTFSLEDNLGELEGGEQPMGSARVANDTYVHSGSAAARLRRLSRSLLQAPGQTLASILQADKLWEQGFRGQGVKMGVFDTGIRGDHPDVKHIVERTNWTHEPTLDDGLGHGSFVAGVIAGTDTNCPGLAPEVLLHTFRVFTNDQVSYTSWFLDAFNYAMATKMNVVNLSIGGPDYLDLPFVEKVAEITSSGIIMVSAIGNDGPLYGTLNNPADQNDVIGIGGIDYTDAIAPFSSRGMSTWEIPLGYGRSKPDVMAYGRDVQGSRIGGGCRSLSGTSVASPVVAGAVCLLSSVVPEDKRWSILNPASMKQALVEGAIRLPGLNLYEQGAGKLSVPNSKTILERYIPRASLVPRKLNFTDCPYMWPFCRQPLYATGMPLMFNATVLNGLSLTGKLEAPPEWAPADEGGRMLDVQFEYSQQLWPWSGYLAVYLRVKPEGAAFTGRANGEFKFTVISPPAKGEDKPRRSTVKVPVVADIIPTPPRSKRVLWDQFHSIRYPPAYFPRDDLQVRHDILDWHGDHPHTNYHEMFDALRDEGYFLEVLASPATCFDASHYGSLLVVDSEDEWYGEEVAKLAADVEAQGMGLLIFADWYHLESIQKLRFYDDNTRSWWEAATGGANVPALNDLLVPFGAAFESNALEAEIVVEGVQGPFHVASGATIKALPAGAWMHRAQGKAKEGQPAKPGPGVLALFQHGKGRVGLYGDSNCLDSSHSRSKCFQLLARMLQWAAGEDVPALTPPAALHAQPFGNFEGMPLRRPDFNFSEVSPVLQTPIRCYPNSPLEFHGASFAQWKVPVSRPVRQTVAIVVETPPEQQAAANGTAAGAAAGAGGAAGAGQQAAGGAGAAGAGQQAAGTDGAAGQQQQQQGAAAGVAQGATQQQEQLQQPGGAATTGQAATGQAATGQQQGGAAQGAATQQQQQQQAGAAAGQAAATQQQQAQQQGDTATDQAAAGAGQQAAAGGQQAAAGSQQAAAGGQQQQQQEAKPDASAAEQEELRRQEAVADAARRKQEEEEAKKQQQAGAAGAGSGAAAAGGTADGGNAAGGGTAAAGGGTGGAAGGAGATTSVNGREHPDIDTLAQAGDGGPHLVEDHSRPKEPADGTDGGDGPTGEGAAARASSRMHQQTAAATSAAVRGGSATSYQQSLLLEGGMLCAIAAAVLWSRSRRRRVLPIRIPRRWLLPMWGGGTAAGSNRNRHE